MTLPEASELLGRSERDVRRMIRRRRREALRTMRGSISLRFAAHLGFLRAAGLAEEIKAGRLRARSVADSRAFLVTVEELARYLDELEKRIEADDSARITRFQDEKAEHIRREFGAADAERYLARARAPR